MLCDNTVLLAKRALTKRHHPGQYGPSAVGTVQSGESYLDTAVREVAEETGWACRPTDLALIHYGPRDSQGHLRWEAVYVCRASPPLQDLHADPDEVADLIYLPLATAYTQATQAPKLFVPAMAALLQHL
jgi:isopentenyldiphosphate isomerase